MSFSENKSIQKVAEKYKISTLKRDFTNKIGNFEFTESFVEDLMDGLKLRKSNSSEYFLCEFLISPLLFKVLKKHSKLNLWSHDCYLDSGDADLSGIPDYIISYKGDSDNYEQLYFPILALADAKKDDFAAGWAQTLAEMYACQLLNKNSELVIYGIVTNGTMWEFGYLKKNIFVQDPISYSIGTNLNKIGGIIDSIYSDTTIQIEKYLKESNIEIG